MDQGYFQRLMAPIGPLVDKLIDKATHPFRTHDEIRERVQKAVGTDRESLIQRSMNGPFALPRNRAEEVADWSIAMGDGLFAGTSKAGRTAEDAGGDRKQGC